MKEKLIQVKGYILESEFRKFRENRVNIDRWIGKCSRRCWNDSESVEAQLAKDCVEELFNCPECDSEVTRENWSVRYGGLCRLCLRDRIAKEKEDMLMARTVVKTEQIEMRRVLNELDRKGTRKFT